MPADATPPHSSGKPLPEHFVRLVVDDRAVATVTLDSQHNRNALSSRLVTELVEAIDAALTANVRAIVLTHEGPAFCSGADLTERARDNAASTSETPPVSGMSLMVQVMQKLMDAPCPTIAAVKGAARAGGIGLMSSCDLVVVDEAVTFALTEVRIGVAPAIISVPILRRVTPSRIAAAMLTGEPFSATAARDMGLVTHVTDDVDSGISTLIEGVLAGAPGAVAATKMLLHKVPEMERDEAFMQMQALSEALFRGPEAAEGMAAFAAKRRPVWSS